MTAYIVDTMRQTYFLKGADWGKTLSAIRDDLRQVFKIDGASDGVLDTAGINSDLVAAIVYELEFDGHVTHHDKRVSTGWFSDDRIDRYYKLTSEGIRFAKSLSAPPKVEFSINGDMNVRTAENVKVEGDAYIARVERLVRADEDVRKFIDETRQLNIQSVELLRQHVYRALEENARLRQRVESRGWSLVEFALGAARFILGF